MRVSTRITSASPSPIGSLIFCADEAKRRETRVFHPNIGQPDIETLAVFFDYVKRYQAEVLSYSLSSSFLGLREKFSRCHNEFGISLSPEEIIVTNGGSEAALFALVAVADPGDEVLVIEPFYADYLGFARTLGITLVLVTSTLETGYAMPEEGVFHSPEDAFYVSVKLPVSNVQCSAQWMLTDFQREGFTTMVASVGWLLRH